MPKWKSGEKKFTVSLEYAQKKGYWCTVPMPIVKLLRSPGRVVFFVNSQKEIEFMSESEVNEDRVQDGKN